MKPPLESPARLRRRRLRLPLLRVCVTWLMFPVRGAMLLVRGEYPANDRRSWWRREG